MGTLANDNTYTSSDMDADEVCEESLPTKRYTHYVAKDYDSVKERFERDHFKCKSAFFCLQPTNGKWERYSKNDFITKEEHVQYEEMVFDRRYKNKKNGCLATKCFVTAWVKDETIRQYNAVMCLPPPLPVPHNVFNTWTGFPIKNRYELKGGDLYTEPMNRVLDHFKAVAADDEQCYQFLLNWIAFIVQRPGTKTGIILIIKSVEKGVGKGIFATIIRALFGDVYCFMSDDPAKELFGEFNIGLKDKLFVVFDESSQQMLSKMVESLKSKITETTQNVNGKYLHMEEGSPSFLNFVMLTNRNIVWEHNDRRPLYLAMSPRLKGSDHFQEVVKSLNDPYFVRHLFDYFERRDLSQFQLERDRPITDLHRNMEARCTPHEVQFLIDFVIQKQNYMNKETGKELLSHGWVKAHELHGFYKDFTKDYKEFKALPLIVFGMRIGELMREGMKGVEKKVTKRGSYYGFNLSEFKLWLKSQNYYCEEGEVESEPMPLMHVGFRLE